MAQHTPGHTERELDGFCCDVLITFAEHPYEWFQVANYRWFDPELDGGTAPPLQIDGVPAQNVTGRVRVEDPAESGWRAWVPLDPALVHSAFSRLLRGPVEGLHESARSRLVGAYIVRDAGMIDVNDADVVLQVALLDEVVYA